MSSAAETPKNVNARPTLLSDVLPNLDANESCSYKMNPYTHRFTPRSCRSCLTKAGCMIGPNGSCVVSDLDALVNTPSAHDRRSLTMGFQFCAQDDAVCKLCLQSMPSSSSSLKTSWCSGLSGCRCRFNCDNFIEPHKGLENTLSPSLGASVERNRNAKEVTLVTFTIVVCILVMLAVIFTRRWWRARTMGRPCSWYTSAANDGPGTVTDRNKATDVASKGSVKSAHAIRLDTAETPIRLAEMA